MTGEVKLPVTSGPGVWMSYYDDGSGVYPHESEIAAHRASMGLGRQVVFVRWGESVRDAERRRAAAIAEQARRVD